MEILDLKLVMMQEYQNIQAFLQNVTTKIGLKNFCYYKS